MQRTWLVDVYPPHSDPEDLPHTVLIQSSIKSNAAKYAVLGTHGPAGTYRAVVRLERADSMKMSGPNTETYQVEVTTVRNAKVQGL